MSSAQFLGTIGAISGAFSGLRGKKVSAGKTLDRVVGKAIRRGAAGAVAGFGADSLTNLSDNTQIVPSDDFERRAEQALASLGQMEKLAEDLATKFSLLRDSLADKALADAKKKPVNRLKKIDCEVCGYQGSPTNKGLCPQCGAVGGVEPRAPEVVHPVNAGAPDEVTPKDGVSVYDVDAVGRLQDQI